MDLFHSQDRDGIKRRFDAVHATRYGYSAESEKAEIVSLRSAVTGLMPKPLPERIATGSEQPSTNAARGTRPVYFGESSGYVDTPTYARNELLAGNRMRGPVLIEEHASTTVVHPGDVVEVDPFGNLAIEIIRS